MHATVLLRPTPTRRLNQSNTRGHEARNATTDIRPREAEQPVSCLSLSGGRRTPAGVSDGAALVGMRAGRPVRMLAPGKIGAFIAALVCLLVPACKVIPQDVLLPTEVLVAREEARIQTGKRGFQMPLLSMGGKAKYIRQTNTENISLEWDDEKSFREAMLATAAGLYTYGQALGKKATEETAQVAAKEGTKREAAKGAAELNALKETNRHKEALMEFEAAAPAVVP